MSDAESQSMNEPQEQGVPGGKAVVADQLIDLLGDENRRIRMLALHMLCESYADSSRILDGVFAGWDRLGPEEAFFEFPMLSYLPVPDSQVEESCRRARQMAEGNKIVAPSARCGGKLIEQLVKLPAETLRPSLALIKETIGTSKIFFRVNLKVAQERIELLDCRADQISAVLDDGLEKLSADPQKQNGFSRGLIGLEALRLRHPDYIDLAAVLKDSEGADGLSPSQIVTLHSLIQFPEPGTEPSLEKFLTSDNEAVFANTVEAMVRAGSVLAAEGLLRQMENAGVENCKWMARGLQRIRLAGLAAGIAAARDQTRDPYLWLMLLVAEVRQFEVTSAERIAFDLARLQSSSEALLDSLDVFLR
ncbi:MAG: hypothetical protein AAGG44_16325, partial [Planctomycetota bacterium]